MREFTVPPTGDGPEWRRRVALAVNALLSGTRASVAPGSPTEGDEYYDLTLHKKRVFDGAVWRDLW